MKSFALIAQASAIIHTAYVPSQGVYMTVDRPMDENLMTFRPQDLKHAHVAWEINDADGDGVEDNVHLTPDQLDKYYKPNYFFPTEHIYNTRNGNLPGHIQKGYYDIQKEPESMELTKHSW